MPPSELYLIGTNHYDFKGPKRLDHFLYVIKPKSVVVERGVSLLDISPPEFANAYYDVLHKLESIPESFRLPIEEELTTQMVNLLKELRNYLGLTGSLNEVSLRDYAKSNGFEQTRSIIYSRINAIDLRIVDLPLEEFLRIHNEYVKENGLKYNGSVVDNFSDVANITKDCILSLSPSKVKDFVETLYTSDKIFDALDQKQIEILMERDNTYVSEIKSCNGKTVFISGLAHIFGPYHNVYEKCRNLGLNSIRYKLNEADKIDEKTHVLV